MMVMLMTTRKSWLGTLTRPKKSKSFWPRMKNQSG